MASQSLYRKWRSQTFAEVVGQEPIMLTLRNSLSTGRLAHAYLFCGPRGTGKTSTGRILAKALNCRQPRDGEPCNQCDLCRAVADGRALDLIEIDAASNRGIDEIRDLREKVRFAPSQARYKVYIIDEVHMLTTDAFNALLKTLEEPPAHVVFILCTTEAHKVPPTVLSRCQRFDFRRISLSAAVGRLRHICASEGIEIDDAGLEVVAKASSGSLRDAENLLDQLIAYYGERIDVNQVRDLLGMVGDARMNQLVGHLVRGELGEGLRLIGDVVADGLDLRQFNRELVQHLRRLLLVKVGSTSLVEASQEELADLRELAKAVSADELVHATKLFSQLDLRYDGQSALPIELAFVECLLDRESRVESASGGRESRVESRGSRVESRGSRVESRGSGVGGRGSRVGDRESGVEGRGSRIEESGVSTVDSVSSSEGSSLDVAGESGRMLSGHGPGPETRDEGREAEGLDSRPPEADSTFDSPPDPLAFARANWSRVLELLRSENRALETYIVPRNADGPYAVEGDRVMLGVGYEVHKNTLEKPQARRTVEEVLRRVLGKKYTMQCVVVPKNEEERLKRAAEDPVIQEALKQGARIVKVE